MQDFMTFLTEKFEQHVAELATAQGSSNYLAHATQKFDDFVEFARKYLAEVNQPLAVAFVPHGLGLRFQHGETVSFIAQQPPDMMRDDSVRITRPMSVPGMNGINDMSSIPISSGR